jgi:hypothetical protein
MRRSCLAASCFFLTSLGLVAIVEACSSFSSSSTPDDGGTGESSTVLPDRDAGSSNDAGVTDAADAAALGDGALKTCASCPSSTVCDDGTCLLTPCTGDGGVVILRPKALVDSNGMFTNTPASLSTEATLRERGDGDGDGTFVEARVGTTSATLKLSSELFTLPMNRTIDSVYIRARSRRTDQNSSASIGLVYWFPSSSNSLLGQNVPTPVGTGYGIANFYLQVPYNIGATAWTETIVNDVQVGVGMNGAASNAPEAAVRLTQVWVEVCLNAL